MFLTLGDIGFGQLTSPTGFESKRPVSYAELQVIEGKPLLQYTGDGLEAITLRFQFHADFCDPQAVWDELTRRLTSHQALSLFQGNGLLLGRFVISDLARTTTVAAADGTLTGFECTVELLEYVDPQPLETQKAAQQAAAPARKQPGERAKVATQKKDLPMADLAPMVSHAQKSPASSMNVDTVASHATRQPVEAATNDSWPILTP